YQAAGEFLRPSPRSTRPRLKAPGCCHFYAEVDRVPAADLRALPRVEVLKGLALDRQLLDRHAPRLRIPARLVLALVSHSRSSLFISCRAPRSRVSALN